MRRGTAAKSGRPFTTIRMWRYTTSSRQTGRTAPVRCGCDNASGTPVASGFIPREGEQHRTGGGQHCTGVAVQDSPLPGIRGLGSVAAWRSQEGGGREAREPVCWYHAEASGSFKARRCGCVTHAPWRGLRADSINTGVRNRRPHTPSRGFSSVLVTVTQFTLGSVACIVMSN